MADQFLARDGSSHVFVESEKERQRGRQSNQVITTCIKMVGLSYSITPSHGNVQTRGENEWHEIIVLCQFWLKI